MLLAPDTKAADVSTQGEFDAAIQQAITTGQPNTINVHTAILSGTGLVLPGLASPLNINFDTAPDFGVGFGSVGDFTIGDGTNLTFAPTTAVARLRVGYNAGGVGTFTMTGGSITAVPTGSFYLVLDIGRTGGTGVFNQSGGTVSMAGGALQIGVDGGQGTYNLSGNGALTMGTGGTVYLGDGPGGVGVLHVSDNASFTSGNQMFIGNLEGTGTITQDGPGSHVVLNQRSYFGTNVDGSNPAGTGTYNLINGDLRIADGAAVSFGNPAGGTGILNQSGGTLTVGNALVYIGDSGAGQYNLSGGLATFSSGLNIAQNPGSTGVVNQSGGTLSLAGGQIRFGAGAGTYNLNGGTLQVGGTNPFATGAGAYQFNLGGGTIQVIGSPLVTGIHAALTGGISTIDTNGFGATWTGVLSGNGALAKSGVGTLALTGNNTYAGGTFLNGGILQAAADSNLGAATSGLTFDGGTLRLGAAFNTARSVTLNGNGGTVDTNGFNSTFSGTFGGAGSFAKAGTGSLTLTSPGSYTGATFINAGILQAGAANVFSPNSAYSVAGGATLGLNNFGQAIGSLAGAGQVALGSATLTTGSDNTSTAFTGAITGSGGLVKTGAGTFALTGASTYTGPTTVNAGVLSVDGSLASQVSVNGGMLSGNGTIGGLNVASGGTISPGHSIGTLNVAGNVAFAPGSTYLVELGPAGQADLIAAAGHASLSGGTVQATGTFVPDTAYTILTAQGGLSGGFAGVSTMSDFAFLSPSLSYTPTSVLLTLEQVRSFASAAITPNQVSVAGALGSLPASNPLFQTILTQSSAAGARQAFDALSGEIHGSVQTTLLDDSRYLRQAVLGRLRQADFTSQPDAFAALNAGGPLVARADPASALAYADPRRPAMPVKSPPVAAALPGPDVAWWAQGVGAWGKIGGDGNASDVSRSLGGFFTGVDSRFGPNWRAGIAGGYTNADVRVNALASSANIDTAHLAAYAGAAYGPWNLRSGASVSMSTIDTSRAILFSGFLDQALARYEAITSQVFGEVGHSVRFGNFAAEPFAGLAWVHLDTNGFGERGGLAALVGSASHEDVGYSTLGARIATGIPLQDGMVLTPRASLAWQHAFGDVTPGASLAFQTAGAAFGISGAPLARDAALVEGGLDLNINPNATIGVSYTGQLSDRANDHSVKGNFTWRF